MIDKIGGFSERGSREINQDRILYLSDEKKGLFIVADGVGGWLHSERASEMICSSFRAWWDEKKSALEHSEFEDDVEEIRNCLQRLNRDIYEATDGRKDSASTVTLLWIKKDCYALFWAGDSRCYQIRQHWFRPKMDQMTIDDIWENESKQRELPEEVLRKQPEYGKLIRAVGAGSELSCSIRTGLLEGRTLFLLCSDGIYKYVEDSLLKKAVRKFYRKKSEADFWGELQSHIEQKEAPDNFSLVYVNTEN